MHKILSKVINKNLKRFLFFCSFTWGVLSYTRIYESYILHANLTAGRYYVFINILNLI